MTTRTCSIGDCDNKHYAKGYCKKHYKSFIENPKKKQLTKSDIKREIIRMKLGLNS